MIDEAQAVGGSSIGGSVDNGRTGIAAFTFYAGPVGIKARNDTMEVAFYAPPTRFKLPIEGMVDGRRVRVMAIRARDLDPDQPARASSTAPRAIIATVVPIEG